MDTITLIGHVSEGRSPVFELGLEGTPPEGGEPAIGQQGVGQYTGGQIFGQHTGLHRLPARRAAIAFRILPPNSPVPQWRSPASAIAIVAPKIITTESAIRI